MDKSLGIIIYTGICAAIIIITLGSIMNDLEKKLVDRQAIEKRAYSKMTKENKELIEYIVFGKSQE